MSEPHRVQLSRTKGWRKPDNTIVVARPTRWGNPFAAKVNPGGESGLSTGARETLVREFQEWLLTPCWTDPHTGRLAAQWDSRRVAFLGVPFHGRPHVDEIVQELRGKNLACWCPLGQPCHADVLLELANKATP